MKKILLLGMAVLAFGFQSLAKSDIPTENRPVEAFNQIVSDGVFTLYLTQGDKEEVVVEVDANLQQEVKVESQKGVLKLSTTREINRKKVKVYVTFKTLNSLTFDGVGKVETKKAIKGDNLDIRVNGVGAVELDLDVKQVSVRVDGVGNVELKGVAKELSIRKDGVGSLNAEDLKAEVVDVRNAGVGNAKVYASKELTMRNSGVGNLTYSGNAIVKSIDNDGVGKIKKDK